MHPHPAFLGGGPGGPGWRTASNWYNLARPAQPRRHTRVSRPPCVAALKRLGSGLHSHTRHRHNSNLNLWVARPLSFYTVISPAVEFKPRAAQSVPSSWNGLVKGDNGPIGHGFEPHLFREKKCKKMVWARSAKTLYFSVKDSQSLGEKFAH